MRSSIKVDFIDRNQGKGLEPVIVVNLSVDTQDVRDKMLSQFFQQLGCESSWLSVLFDSTTHDSSRVIISPITPKELEETRDIISNRLYLPPEKQYVAIQALLDIQEWQTNFVELSKTTEVYKIAEKALQQLRK